MALNCDLKSGRLSASLPQCRREIDRVFGDGYATAHPNVVSAVVQSAAATGPQPVSPSRSNAWLRRILVEKETQQHLVLARELLRARP